MLAGAAVELCHVRLSLSLSPSLSLHLSLSLSLSLALALSRARALSLSLSLSLSLYIHIYCNDRCDERCEGREDGDVTTKTATTSNASRGLLANSRKLFNSRTDTEPQGLSSNRELINAVIRS
jgi:hypothetical protein